MNRGIFNWWIVVFCIMWVCFLNDFVCIFNRWYRVWGKIEFFRMWIGVRSWGFIFLGFRLYIGIFVVCRELKCVVIKW